MEVFSFTYSCTCSPVPLSHVNENEYCCTKNILGKGKFAGKLVQNVREEGHVLVQLPLEKSKCLGIECARIELFVGDAGNYDGVEVYKFSWSYVCVRKYVVGYAYICEEGRAVS